jgi:hypothetical protein
MKWNLDSCPHHTPFGGFEGTLCSSGIQAKKAEPIGEKYQLD